MCPQTPSLSPEYSHKAGLQAVITSMPLKIRPITQGRPRRARYNGPDHTWALGLNEAVPREDVAAGLRQSAEWSEGCPCPLCLCQTIDCGGGLERRVASLPSPQQRRIVHHQLRWMQKKAGSSSGAGGQRRQQRAPLLSCPPRIRPPLLVIFTSSY
jgi:hypothetical protein